MAVYKDLWVKNKLERRHSGSSVSIPVENGVVSSLSLDFFLSLTSIYFNHFWLDFLLSTHSQNSRNCAQWKQHYEIGFTKFNQFRKKKELEFLN